MTGYIATELVTNIEDTYVSIYGSITVADCSNTITLTLKEHIIEGEEEKDSEEKNLYKLDTMIATLQRLKADYKAQVQIEREKEKNENN